MELACAESCCALLCVWWGVAPQASVEGGALQAALGSLLYMALLSRTEARAVQDELMAAPDEPQLRTSVGGWAAV